MGLDIRLPIGLLFSVIGLMLTIYGAVTRHAAIYERSLGINVNLSWGLVLLFFGIVMLILGRHGSSASAATTGVPADAGVKRGH